MANNVQAIIINECWLTLGMANEWYSKMSGGVQTIILHEIKCVLCKLMGENLTEEAASGALMEATVCMLFPSAATCRTHV